MSKKKVVLFIIAGVLAISGIAALPSGNIAGGIGCIIIAAVCIVFALKAQPEKKEGIVYVEENGSVYHSDRDCSGMKNPKAIPISKARKKYRACQKCYKYKVQ